jgi:hypothetical protein
MIEHKIIVDLINVSVAGIHNNEEDIIIMPGLQRVRPGWNQD